MAEFSVVHIGINANSEQEAKAAAERFCLLFGFPVKVGNSSVFAGTGIEIMKEPYKGTHGHIAVATPDVETAQKELEARGIAFDAQTAKTLPDGTLNAIYLKEEICGFAVHLVRKKG